MPIVNGEWRKEGLSWEEILEIARRKGIFYVSAHAYNDTLRRKCRRLCFEGLLRHDGNWRRYGAFGNYYLPVEGKESNDHEVKAGSAAPGPGEHDAG